MSLVAYGASDDSEASDIEDGETISSVPPPQQLNSNDISETDGADGFSGNNNNVPSQSQCQTAFISKTEDNAYTSVLSTLNGTISDEEEAPDFQKALPAPKAKSVASSVLDVTEDDELEDIVKPKPSQLADVVKPSKRQGKGRQPVKITIPSLSTDPDEDDEPQRKKLKPSTKASGLTSLLPAPKNLSLKETNRILLPHTLKKLPPSAQSSKGKPTAKVAPQVPRNKPTSLVGGVPDSDSDDDGNNEGMNFFSIGDKPAGASCTTGSYPSVEQTVRGFRSSLILPPVSSNIPPLTPNTTTTQPDSLSDPELLLNSKNTATPSSQTVGDNKSPECTEDSSSVSQDLPLSFSTQTNQDAPLSFKSGHVVQSHQAPYGYHRSDVSHYGYMGDGKQQSCPSTGELYQENQDSDVEKYLQDEEFLKLQGKKQRGREQVNFIDIDTNEFTGTQDLMKTISVEQEHTSHRKKDNTPSGRQRHKHQITYLAYQAKERELTLKNQWAQNRQTKRQTQSKYGF